MHIAGYRNPGPRFPTSRTHDGTDAVHKDPDYSAAYVILRTDAGLEGHGFTFTIGRGNEICAEAISAFRQLVVGQRCRGDRRGLRRVLAPCSPTTHSCAGLGPEKGVIHISARGHRQRGVGSHAKRSAKPVWKLLADMTPRQIVSAIDFRYITDALTPEEAIEILERQAPRRRRARPILLRDGYPAYTTSAGWMGYSDEKVRRLCHEGLDDGFTHFKVKVGGTIRPTTHAACGVVRDAIGPDAKLMIDANQRWDVGEAIARVARAGAGST